MIRPFLIAATVLTVAACTEPTGNAPADLSIGLIAATGDTAPSDPPGACWARDVIPAVIETEIVQIAVPARPGATAGSFRSETSQKIVQDRRDVWFRTPCPADLTVTFVASLQRALKARGLYTAAVTGRQDHATGEAVRRFQEMRGLDSAVLSLAAARDLGLIAVDRATLE